ncbi:MAG: dihydrodipicolinate synthase family protein [Deltaproteobacteria bacterium]|nr:dihydrodipicolinate synthase family protein [Deltaproteobacteria bacterium]
MPAGSQIKGIVMPVPTPFLEDGELDEKVFEQLVDFYLASGAHALFINGSYGQGPAMPENQRKRTAEIAVRRARRRVPVMVHIGAVDPYTSSDLGRHARSTGADAVAIVGPYYYSDHTEYEIVEHFRSVDQATELPVLVYNNPAYQGYAITPAMMAGLREAVPRIFGSKLARGTIPEAQRYRSAVGGDFSLFAPADNLFPGMLVGITGSISPPLSAAPEIGVRLVDAIEKRDWEKATVEQIKILEFLAATDPLFAQFGRSSQREALRLRGFDVKRFPRWPARPLTEQARKTLRESLEKLDIPLGS